MGKGPSSLNLVSLTMALGLAASAYCAWKFFPVYFMAWQVDHVLADGAARAYPVSKVGDVVARGQSKNRLVEDLRREVVALGVNDPEMTLTLEMDSERVDVTCSYRAVIVHPVVSRFTMLRFHRVASGSLAPPRY